MGRVVEEEIREYISAHPVRIASAWTWAVSSPYDILPHFFFERKIPCGSEAKEARAYAMAAMIFFGQEDQAREKERRGKHQR